MTSTHSLKIFFGLFLALFFTGCVAQQSSPWQGRYSNSQSNTQINTGAENRNVQIQSDATPSPIGAAVKIGFLAPLSGNGAAVGQSLVNAAQLAVFDLPSDSVELLPRDSGGSSNSARSAAQSAINDGATIILGPLYAQEVKALNSLSSPNRPVVGFTTDWTEASANTFVMGFLPHAQVERVLDYAARNGMRNLSIVAPSGEYGNLVTAAAQRFLQNNNLSVPRVINYTSAQQAASELQALQRNPATKSDAVLFASRSSEAASIINSVRQSGVALPRLIGTGLWDDDDALSQTALKGAIYAGPEPSEVNRFSQKYRSVYGETPPRVASLGYDSAAMVLSLVAENKALTSSTLSNPAGFSGIDGFFKFRNDGLIERSLSILEIENGRRLTRERAQKSMSF
ncbi:MAG: hypothetical protein CL565_03170 [Alphaproteobacteria bacterium]|nr:hypothetical protein [Alphaproteobacteria bacterium]